MKMKLRAAGGENHRCDLNSVNGTDRPGRRESGRSTPLDKEAVFEWFGLQLSPAGRVELLCGLLHMCQPLELRFLGACLEDLARRDFTVLRDFETRANCPADLEGLVDVSASDPVVLSKLLVYVSLLGSKSRECAGILFRTLNRIEAGMCGAVPEPETVDQLRLLFTMGSLHPAFSFHQREELRAQLDRLQEWVCNITLNITAITPMKVRLNFHSHIAMPSIPRYSSNYTKEKPCTYTSLTYHIFHYLRSLDMVIQWLFVPNVIPG